MTSAIVNEAERLSLIHATGYWRVQVRPTVFEPQRISSLKACWDMVESARVHLRGWDYPHVESREQITGEDYVQSGSTFANHIELWRFYQSGQFAHQFAMWEDRKPPSLDMRTYGPTPVREAPLQLGFVEVVYTLTEVFEFGRGLAYRGVLEPATHLAIELHGTQGRQLSSPSSRIPLLVREASVDQVCWGRTLLSSELIATAPEVAIDAAVHVFERFGWDAPRSMLAEEQRRLLERRL